MGEIVITLSAPLDLGGGETTDRVVLREPRMRELLALGKPFHWIMVAGKPQLVEDDETIKAFIERLVIKPDIPALLGNICLADGLKIRAAFLDFFEKSEVSAALKARTSSD